jgi:tetratricopeptide (TPR) repeat protein
MRKCLILPLLFALLATAASGSRAAQLDQIGTFDFPTSGSPAAQEHFTLGVGYLHSFGFIQAQAEFRLAQELQPDFALAYWGEVFTYNHPFIGEWDAESPAKVLMRLGRTSEERLAKAPTEREKGFLRAAEAYAMTPGPVGNKRLAWMQAMADLYAQFPDDREVQAFYTVALLSGATAVPEASRDRLNMQAGALALRLFKENENHPGAAHYTIHAFDDPIHAPIALEAAFHYADIAPAVAHARHMPTHIFIQHGMWKEVSLWNESSFNAGADLWQPGDRPNDMNHSSDWGQYGDLQLGDLARSELWIKRAEQVLKDNPGDARSEATLRTMQARHIIESGHWQTRELTDGLNGDELLALGLSAVNLDDLKLAQRVAERLAKLVSDSPNNEVLRVSQMEVEGFYKLRDAEHQLQAGMSESGSDLQQEALTLLTNAVALTDAQRPPNGAANPLKPVHELAGEAMLATNHPQQAAELFDASLLRTPNRPWSLLGAARSHASMNHADKAAGFYRALLAIWSDDSNPAVQEARRYLQR